MIDKLLSQLSEDGPLMLLFHGVVKENDYEVRNMIRKHIEQDYFADILKALKSNGTALSVDDVVEIRTKGDSYPKNSFVVTFDDGFENNSSVAAPILDDLQIPSVFYITSDFVENGTMSWTDKAEYALEKTPQGKLEFEWAKGPITFSDTKEKQEAMSYLRSYVFQNPSINVHDLIDDIYEQLGIPLVQTTDDPLDKKMSWKQVSDMHNHDLFTIGGHTHTHIVMAFEPPDVMEEEIDTNLNMLDAKAGIKTTHFAYPQGQSNHYNDAVIASLKARGIVCCPTAIEGHNTRDTGLFHLYRTMVV